jgi:hypothetical protein
MSLFFAPCQLWRDGFIARMRRSDAVRRNALGPESLSEIPQEFYDDDPQKTGKLYPSTAQSLSGNHISKGQGAAEGRSESHLGIELNPTPWS